MKTNSRLFIWTGIVLIVLTMVSLFFLRYDSSAVAKTDSQGGRCRPFQEKLSKEDGDKIQEIIYTLSHTSAPGLLFKKGRLEGIGKELDKKVPALEFLGFIFSHPKMASDMRIIRESSLKYGNFVQGIQENLIEDHTTGCLDERAKSFAKFLKLPEAKVLSHLKEGMGKVNDTDRAFKPFVDHLIEAKSPKKGKVMSETSSKGQEESKTSEKAKQSSKTSVQGKRASKTFKKGNH